MDDQLDNDLKNRIREVFDNYEDTSADEGWLLLREKFPEKQREHRAFALLWWGAAAAVLLMFLGIGLWMKNEQEKPKNFAVKTTKHSQAEDIAVKKLTKDSVNINTTASVADKNIAGIKPPQNAGIKHPQNHQAGLLSHAAIPNSAGTKYYTKTTQSLPLADTITKNNLIAQNKVDSLKTALNKTTAPQLAINNEPKSDLPKSVTMKEKKPEKTIMDMFNEDKSTKTSKKDDVLPSKAVRFGVYAATYFNYSKGSDNQVNVGAGFTSDIRISKNLKLVTGVAIAQNSLSYASFPSNVASEKSNLFVPAAASVDKFTALSTPTVKNYNASLVGLDVPVNLKYEFNPEKNDTYFSLGLSSGTFIDESYTYKYNYPSLLSPMLQAPQDESSGKNFSSFYFAKTLNVAFGVGYPFGKNRLIIEPFLKYPLDGMGSQNLRFGAGGLNLKLNFQSSHK